MNQLRGTGGTTTTLGREFLGDQSFGLSEVPPTLAGGGDTGGWVCNRVVAGGLAAVHVLTAGKSQVATGGVFVEPQLPVTHSWRSVGGGRRRRIVRAARLETQKE